VLTAQQEERLEQWLIQTEQGTNTEIIVVTIGSLQDYPGSNNGSIEEFAKGLFNTWVLGTKPISDGLALISLANCSFTDFMSSPFSNFSRAESGP
ncbi:TPM domain-containing protein, partial [Candidatus Deferrimicrobium sp.]|uniref:TPM domain-containing protein n=1 Tax=Candidatus Deferrimicrobium sp. TaxID=3060586 RepID=UPI002ED2C911